MLNPVTKHLIPDKARAAKRLGKEYLLILIKINSYFIGFKNLLVHAVVFLYIPV